MTVEQIENFLAKETIPQGKIIRFELKKRNPVRGLIVQGRDYADLKAKNFWRIVTKTHFNAYSTSNDVGLAKIFNGSAFTRLSVFKDDME